MNRRYNLVVMTNGDVYHVSDRSVQRIEAAILKPELDQLVGVTDLRTARRVWLNVRHISSVVGVGVGDEQK